MDVIRSGPSISGSSSDVLFLFCFCFPRLQFRKTSGEWGAITFQALFLILILFGGPARRPDGRPRSGVPQGRRRDRAARRPTTTTTHTHHRHHRPHGRAGHVEGFRKPRRHAQHQVRRGQPQLHLARALREGASDGRPRPAARLRRHQPLLECVARRRDAPTTAPPSARARAHPCRRAPWR